MSDCFPSIRDDVSMHLLITIKVYTFLLTVIQPTYQVLFTVAAQNNAKFSVERFRRFSVSKVSEDFPQQATVAVSVTGWMLRDSSNRQPLHDKLAGPQQGEGY